MSSGEKARFQAKADNSVVPYHTVLVQHTVTWASVQFDQQEMLQIARGMCHNIGSWFLLLLVNEFYKFCHSRVRLENITTTFLINKSFMMCSQGGDLLQRKHKRLLNTTCKDQEE